jgi:ankyrin repeat protein
LLIKAVRSRGVELKLGGSCCLCSHHIRAYVQDSLSHRSSIDGTLAHCLCVICTEFNNERYTPCGTPISGDYSPYNNSLLSVTRIQPPFTNPPTLPSPSGFAKNSPTPYPGHQYYDHLIQERLSRDISSSSQQELSTIVLKGLADAGFKGSKTYRKNPNSALKWAIDNYDYLAEVEKTVEILLDSGADVDTVSTHGALLHVATRYQNIALMRLLVDKGADVDLKTPSDFVEASLSTPLIVATFHGCALSARVLLAAGANVDAQTPNLKNSMLSLAILSKKAGLLVPMLLAHGARLEIPNAAGVTPLQTAVIKNDLGATIALLESGAAIHGKGKSIRPFTKALQVGDMDMVSTLLLYGADVHSSEALTTAVNYGHGAIVRLLLEEYSADEDLQHVDKKSGNTILRDPSVVDLIMGYGISVDAEDAFGSTPLHDAAQVGSIVMVKKLLEHGANMHWQNHKGKMPVDLAVEHRHREVVECLGGKRQSRNKDKKSWWRRS